MATQPRNAMGPRIRELRLARGMILEDLATAIGNSASHISRIERGLTAPSLTVAMRIARALGVRPSDLATIERDQTAIDAQLVTALTGSGLDTVTAQHVCARISTAARRALLQAVTG